MKVRSGGYSLGTDDRAIREYIFHETERLKRQGIKNVYFLVISSRFKEDCLAVRVLVRVLLNR